MKKYPNELNLSIGSVKSLILELENIRSQNWMKMKWDEIVDEKM